MDNIRYENYIESQKLIIAILNQENDFIEIKYSENKQEKKFKSLEVFNLILEYQEIIDNIIFKEFSNIINETYIQQLNFECLEYIDFYRFLKSNITEKDFKYFMNNRVRLLGANYKKEYNEFNSDNRIYKTLLNNWKDAKEVSFKDEIIKDVITESEIQILFKSNQNTVNLFEFLVQKHNTKKELTKFNHIYYYLKNNNLIETKNILYKKYVLSKFRFDYGKSQIKSNEPKQTGFMNLLDEISKQFIP